MSAQSFAISSASTGSPITITTTTPHSFVVGQAVVVSGVVGSAAANGKWLIAATPTSTTFELAGSVGTSLGSGGTASSVAAATTAAHALIPGQSVSISGSSVSSFNGLWSDVAVMTTTTFSLPLQLATATGATGNFGDGGRSIPSAVGLPTPVVGRWLRVDQTLNLLYYGAKCDNVTDDSAVLQGMIAANPGGRWILPGSRSTPVSIFMGNTSIYLLGAGYILEGGGSEYLGAEDGGTTLRWNAGVTGLIALNSNGSGVVRNINLEGGERFQGAQGGTWPDAILPNFTDQTGTNPFTVTGQATRDGSGVVTFQTLLQQFGGINSHTFSVGTQINVSVPGATDMEGLYYVTSISQSNDIGYDLFTYASPGAAKGPFPATAGNAITGTSTADAIIAGSNCLILENLNIQWWGRYGINVAADGITWWADDQSFRNIKIVQCRGVGTMAHGTDSQASDFQQIQSQSNLAGGILDCSQYGNLYLSPNVSDCGVDFGSLPGTPVSITAISCTANVVTVTAPGHTFVLGQAVVLAGLSDPTLEAPSGSAVFVASVSGSNFTYNFMHANGAPAGGGTARLATGSELYTVAGIGQLSDQSGGGAGFSYWVAGITYNQVLLNPYAEGSNGPLKFATNTIVIGGILGVTAVAPGFDFPAMRLGQGNGSLTANIAIFDQNMNGIAPGKLSQYIIQGGIDNEQPIEVDFYGHRGFRPRWHMLDNPAIQNPRFQLGRKASATGAPRLTFYQGADTYTLASASRDASGVATFTTVGPHGIGFGSYVNIAGVVSTVTFNGDYQQVVNTTSLTFQCVQGAGSPEVATPGTGTATTTLNSFAPGETHLSSEDAGSIALNYDGGTGGVRICDGATNDVVVIDGTGLMTTYNGIATKGNGIPAEYALWTSVPMGPQSASIALTSLYSVTASGLFRISYYLRVMTAATTSSSVKASFEWVDPDDATHTYVTQTTASPANSTASTGAGVVTGSFIFDAAAGYDIKFFTTYVSSGATHMTYKLIVSLEAL